MHRFRNLYILLLFLLAAGCGTDHTVNEGVTVFRYNESKGITSLDPAFARNQTIIWPVSQIFNGLVQLNDSLEVVPSLATSWEISDDGLTYTFFLRPGISFHPSPFISPGRVVTAEDFVYSLNRILDPVIASPGSWIFDYLVPENPVLAINDTTLRIRLRDPFPPFLSILAMPYCYVVPREAVENTQLSFAHNPVGTGPFLFKTWNQGEKLVLLKNPDYFEKDEEGGGLPYLDAVSITFIKDKQSEFLEFLKGNLDFLSGVHAAYKDELLTRSGTLNPKYSGRLKLLTHPYLNTEYLGILQVPVEEGDPVLLSREFRQAINYGFDREKMMKYLRNNLGYPATAGMIPPGLKGHLEPGKGYTYDPDRARALLAEIDYAPGSDPVQLTTTSDYLDLCEYIQFELQKIGIQLEISVSTGGAFRNQVANGNLPFFRASWIADYADAENYLALFYSGNHTPQGPNYTKFSSPEFDSLYEESINEPGASGRYWKYRLMDSIIMEEAPVVPLFYDMVVRFTQSGVEGFNPNAMNNLILKTVRKSPARVTGD